MLVFWKLDMLIFDPTTEFGQVLSFKADCKKMIIVLTKYFHTRSLLKYKDTLSRSPA